MSRNLSLIVLGFLLRLSRGEAQNEVPNNVVTTAFAIFLLFCMLLSIMFTMLFIKEEFDRRFVQRRLLNCGIAITGQVIKQMRPQPTDTTRQAQTRRMSVRMSFVDPLTGLVGGRRATPTNAVGVEYAVKNSNGSGETITYFAEFCDESLYDSVIEGGPVQLIVHPDNPKIVRPISAAEETRFCAPVMNNNGSPQQGINVMISACSVGILSISSACFSICFLLFYLAVFEGAKPMLRWQANHVLPWVIFAVIVLGALAVFVPRFFSYETTVRDFENGKEVAKANNGTGEQFKVEQGNK